MIRRTFLKALLGAPAAAPVIAREAAQKAHVSTGIGSLANIQGPSNPRSGGGLSLLDDARRQLADLATDDTRARFLRETTTHQLDPDLAASRSLSLSAALRIQRERDWRRFRDWRADGLMALIANLTEG